MKTGQIILIAVVFLVIGIIASNWYIKTKYVCYYLPTEGGGPNYWGKFYWKSLHETVQRIPCSLCQPEAVSLMEFLHDKINLKLSKPLHNEENFYAWVDKISELKK